jgi:hypothetical protein
VISPYAKNGYVDHQILSFDAYVKFIEDDFLAGQRLDPATDGRPDPRPDVRENASVLGNLATEFDFTQTPRPPMLLPVHPATTLTALPPFGPLAPTATPGNNQATVQWTAPISDGGKPITGYRITPSLNGTAQAPRTFNSTVTTQTVTALTNGLTYTFTIEAINAKGLGLASHPTLPITVGAPRAPQAAVASPGNGAANVSWTPPNDNGSPISLYRVTPYRNGLPQQPQYFAPGSARVVTGLTNGSLYTFTVAASNSWGTGPSSSATAPITIGAPTKPTAVTASAGSARATVHWTAPSTANGSSITGYLVTPYLGNAAQPPRTFASTATTQAITGLQSGTTYKFTVAATNGRGNSPQSAASNSITVS